MHSTPHIRKLTHLDWDMISSIYDEGVFIGNATFENKVPSWFQWNKNHHDQCRFVAELNQQVIAFGSITEYSLNPHFSGVAQLEMYVSQGYQNSGVGSKLLEKIVRFSETLNFWSLQVQIFKSNKKASDFLIKKGFRIIGEQQKIIFKGEAWQNVLLLERRSEVVGNS